MCGICGIVQNRPIDRQDLIRMRDTLIHRGPDDAGVWLSDGAGAGRPWA
jgi:asparagine synthase (glutamine-hydrolysing)